MMCASALNEVLGGSVYLAAYRFEPFVVFENLRMFTQSELNSYANTHTSPALSSWPSFQMEDRETRWA